jgi:hypothetical protein
VGICYGLLCGGVVGICYGLFCGRLWDFVMGYFVGSDGKLLWFIVRRVLGNFYGFLCGCGGNLL